VRFYTDKLNSKIQLDELEIQLHLGVSEEERAKPQSVWISLAFEFSALPESTSSDLISGTVNYSSLSKLLKSEFNGSNIKTIEYMGFRAFNLVSENIDRVGRLTLSIRKFPSISGLKGGALFELSGDIN
jgi:dihydroneopterin aldolase